MRYLVFFIFFCSCLNAFTFSINSGKHSGNPYYIIHLQDDKEMICDERNSEENKIYSCKVFTKLNQNLKNQDLPFAKISFHPLDDGFVVIIEPKITSRIFNANNRLFDSQNSKANKSNRSKHFTININKQLNELDTSYINGIEFPIKYPNLLRPSVGALDLNKEPITYNENGDMGIYLLIKRNYERQNYKEVIFESQKAMKSHPDSIFLGEFLLYQIRSMDKLIKEETQYQAIQKMNSNIIELAKVWMRFNGSDRNYPEILYVNMMANLSSDLFDDAEYILDILMTEHSNDTWTNRAIIGYADHLVSRGKLNDAMRFYEDVLYSSNDVDVASEASFKLVKIYLSQQRFSEAAQYIDKVVVANPKYIINDKGYSMEVADELRVNNLFDTAAKIYKVVFDDSHLHDGYYEISLRRLGTTLVRGVEPVSSYEYLQKYKQEFPDNEFSSEIEYALDRLFFDMPDMSSDEKHAHYNKLLDKYQGQELAKIALIAEVKLSFDEKRYNDILNLNSLIVDLNQSDITDMMNTSALNLANRYNQNLDCLDVVGLVDKYEIENQIVDKFKLFNCYYRTKRYTQAYNLANENINDPNLNNRVVWLNNLTKINYKLSQFIAAIDSSFKAVELASKVPYSDPSEAIIYRFYSLLKLDRFDEATLALRAVEDNKGIDIMLIEAYDAAMIYANDKGNKLAKNYSKKVLDLQTKLNIDTFSPEANFIYIDNLVADSELLEAKNMVLDLLNRNLKPQNRARALHTIAQIEISQNNPKAATPYINECLNIAQDSQWKALCNEQKRLVDGI
ncbi:tetratricopeptide repeat protein [Campylobacter sp. CX2-8023-23]|uniref:tetratricopeptide repeat protein n=1 Tax=Campylobacter porcelli TaxID=1660073 RepID=UPI002EB9F50B|nr:tetratricopeptide repeat protein [Campylobacter sp. CX2-8023-23]